MSSTEDPKNKKDTTKAAQLSLKEYLELKKKKSLKLEDQKLPLMVKFFILFPILVLCFILCFGIFCMPRLSTTDQHPQTEQK